VFQVNQIKVWGGSREVCEGSEEDEGRMGTANSTFGGKPPVVSEMKPEQYPAITRNYLQNNKALPRDRDNALFGWSS
jgi:hypothetical protein